MSLLKIGSTGQEVKNLQTNLNHLGAKLTVDGNFGAVTQASVVSFQKARGILADGQVGPVTQAEITKALIAAASGKVLPPPPMGVYPWRQWFLDRLGWTEFDHDKELSVGWKFTNVPSYPTVIGAHYAWCAESLNFALATTGYQYSHDAGAISFVGVGTSVDWKTKGVPLAAIVVIEHPDGEHHVTTANRDHKPGELILEALGGNQNNSICVEIFKVSPGNHKILYVGMPVKA